VLTGRTLRCIRLLREVAPTPMALRSDRQASVSAASPNDFRILRRRRSVRQTTAPRPSQIRSSLWEAAPIPAQPFDRADCHIAELRCFQAERAPSLAETPAKIVQ